MLVAVRISTGCHTNCHRWSGLTTEICFLTVLETGKSKIRMPAMVWFLVRRAPSWLSDSRLLTMSSHGGFYRDTNPIDQGPILLTPVNLNYFLTPNTFTLGVRASVWGAIAVAIVLLLLLIMRLIRNYHPTVFVLVTHANGQQRLPFIIFP